MLTTAAFSFDPVTAGLEHMALATERLARALSPAIRFDGHRGSVSLDPVALVRAAEGRLPDRLLQPLMSALQDVAVGGMAVFGTPDEVEKRTAVAVPWVVISDLAYGLRGTHATMRDALGIKGAATPEEAVSRLRRNFPNVPEWLVAGGAAQRLTRDPVGLMGEGGGMGGRDDPPEGPPPKPPGNPPAPGGSGGIVVPPVDLAVEVAKCLVRGKWGPAFGSWWGWAYGFQVCLDQGCADKLAKLLGGLGGGKALADVIGQVAAAESVAAGIKALAVTAAMALALYGLLLAANILAVNWAKGVCLLFNWPVIGGPGMFVIAIAGS